MFRPSSVRFFVPSNATVLLVSVGHTPTGRPVINTLCTFQRLIAFRETTLNSLYSLCVYVSSELTERLQTKLEAILGEQKCKTHTR